MPVLRKAPNVGGNCKDPKTQILYLDIKFIFLTLLALNILAIYFNATDKKYLAGPIIIWAATVVTFLYYLLVFFPSKNLQLDIEETKYFDKQLDKNYKFDKHAEWDSLTKRQKKLHSYNRPVFELMGLQTLLTFISLLIGYQTTQQKTYRWTSWAFGILTGIYLIIELIAGIVPSSGMVG